ncbi:hypothetical protein K2173_013170 [Erythroxylum novogranatense]|uniref:Sulphate adenylyltransferase catalytic domain-containing protein n=1 Tax=Erythroxylum novogranatense TaxID=1862640 RepID=A0AAV8TEU9_9ROSI|nr:hypothetical protein K2173_013170 [Erythroxylum novogranatense]
MCFQVNTGKRLWSVSWNGTVLLAFNIEIYKHPKEERIAIIQGTTTPGLLYVEEAITNSGNWLIGGDLEVIEPIKYNDGLDRFRLSPAELREEFAKRNADAILAFQLRNPVHNGHGNRKRLLEMGYKNPMLLLHPLGGYTKADDFPLSWRMRQHEKNGFIKELQLIRFLRMAFMVHRQLLHRYFHRLCTMLFQLSYNGKQSSDQCRCKFLYRGWDPAGMSHPVEK